jgi:pilus assembly protein TadC
MFGFRAEPVAIITLVQAILGVAVAFDVGNLTQERQAMIVVLVNAFLGVFLRSQVTSETTLRRAGTTKTEVQSVADDPARVMEPMKSPSAIKDVAP